MERLTNKKEADTQRKQYEIRLASGYPRNMPEERFLKLAAYEDTGLEPEDFDALQKREQGLAELLVQVSCGCAVSYARLAELAQAEKDGRLVALQEGVTVRRLQEEYRKAKHMAYERLPSPDYTTGRIAGFGAGVVHILDKILAREEAEAALKKREGGSEMNIDKVIEILDSGKDPETEQDFEDFDTAIETAINLLKTHPDNQPNEPLALEDLREMYGEPVYDWMGYEWFVILEVTEDDVIMTDGTVFDIDEESPNNADGRFCRRKPEDKI